MHQSSKETMMLNAKTFPLGADRRESALLFVEESLTDAISPYSVMPDLMKALPHKTLR